MGASVFRLYVTRALPRSLQGEVLDPYHVANASVSAFLHRLFLYEPSLSPHPLIYSPSIYAIAYPLCQLAAFLPLFAMLRTIPPRPVPTHSDREQLDWAAFLFALLVLSPVPSSYHFVAMILSVILLTDVLLHHHAHRLAALAIGLYALISLTGLWDVPAHLPSALFTFLSFSRLWFSMLLFTVFLLSLKKVATTDPTPTTRRTILLYTGAGLAFLASVLGYRAHFAHLPQQMSRYVLPPAATLLATAPQPLPTGSYLYTAMVQDGYHLLNQQNQPIYPGPTPRPPDQLTYAIAPDGSILLELADLTGSRIVRVPTPNSPAQTLIPNAESPAISPDGQTIAFLRERKGRATLWTAHLTNEAATHQTQITGDTYDVYQATFLPTANSPNTLLFTAKQKKDEKDKDEKPGLLTLFLAVPGFPPHPLAPGEEIASFAPDPTSSLIAITRLLHNRWQLGTLDPITHSETTLTTADCNAYTPTWPTPQTLLYATDCGRGLALTALASLPLP
jgi:WD40-like Beta Propeller Repeat